MAMNWNYLPYGRIYACLTILPRLVCLLSLCFTLNAEAVAGNDATLWPLRPIVKPAHRPYQVGTRHRLLRLLKHRTTNRYRYPPLVLANFVASGPVWIPVSSRVNQPLPIPDSFFGVGPETPLCQDRCRLPPGEFVNP